MAGWPRPNYRPSRPATSTGSSISWAGRRSCPAQETSGTSSTASAPTRGFTSRLSARGPSTPAAPPNVSSLHRAVIGEEGGDVATTVGSPPSAGRERARTRIHATLEHRTLARKCVNSARLDFPATSGESGAFLAAVKLLTAARARSARSRCERFRGENVQRWLTRAWTGANTGGDGAARPCTAPAVVSSRCSSSFRAAARRRSPARSAEPCPEQAGT